MKLKRDNLFGNCIVRSQEWLSGINFSTSIGNIKKFLFGCKEDSLDYDYEESIPAIYHLSIYDESEYEFILTLLQSGYTVITDTGNLLNEDKERFNKKLQISLFGTGIYIHRISNNSFIIAPQTVEIIDFEEPKKKKAKIINFADYRKE